MSFVSCTIVRTGNLHEGHVPRIVEDLKLYIHKCLIPLFFIYILQNKRKAKVAFPFVLIHCKTLTFYFVYKSASSSSAMVKQ